MIRAINLLWIWALVGLALMVGCADTERARCADFNAVNGDHCSPVQVSTSVDNAKIIHARIVGELHEGDGIAVNWQNGSDYGISDDIITIVASSHGVMVISQDHWLPANVAEDMLTQIQKDNSDRLKQVLTMINKIHEWQATHPRPAQNAPAIPASAAPVAPPPPVTVTVTTEPPKPSAPPPPYDAGPVWIAWGIVLGSILAYVTVGVTLLRVWTLRCKKNCDACENTIGLCGRHSWQGLLIIWPLFLIGYFISRISTVVGNRLARVEPTARQQRKLVDAQNKTAQLAVDKKMADAEYLKALAVVEGAGIQVPGAGLDADSTV